MKTLSLNLSDSLASNFEKLQPKEKMQVEKMLTGVLEEMVKREQNKALFASMNRLAEEAEKNGLTISKLAEIMAWDDATVRNLFGDEVSNGN